MSAENINICGVPHKIEYVNQNFGVDCHFGEIDFQKCLITINDNMHPEMKQEAICHEVLHGILAHLGYEELTNDETFVNAVSNAIYQSFTPKIWVMPTNDRDEVK